MGCTPCNGLLLRQLFGKVVSQERMSIQRGDHSTDVPLDCYQPGPLETAETKLPVVIRQTCKRFREPGKGGAAQHAEATRVRRAVEQSHQAQHRHSTKSLVPTTQQRLLKCGNRAKDLAADDFFVRFFKTDA